MLRRLKVLAIGLLLGASFSLWTAGPMMPSRMQLSDQVLVWVSVMGGPIVGTSWGMVGIHPFIGLGWLGIPLIPSHLIRPCAATGCLTLFGLSLWFFAGFLAEMASAWGA